MKTIFNFIVWLILPKKLNYQGLILKKKFTFDDNFSCLLCYFYCKNRQCPENKNGNLICKDNIFFKKINIISRGIGSSRWFFYSRCYLKSNIDRIKKEIQRREKNGK